MRFEMTQLSHNKNQQINDHFESSVQVSETLTVKTYEGLKTEINNKLGLTTSGLLEELGNSTSLDRDTRIEEELMRLYDKNVTVL